MEKLLFHVTTVLHNSRYSPRMREYNLDWKNYKKLTLQDEIALTKIIKQIVIENQLEILAFNICGDHMHMIIIIEEPADGAGTSNLNRTIGRLKGISSRRWSLNKGVNPLDHPPSERYADGTIEPLWAQKFNRRLISTPEDLERVINYITTNRLKHKLEESKELQQVIDSFLTLSD